MFGMLSQIRRRARLGNAAPGLRYIASSVLVFASQIGLTQCAPRGIPHAQYQCADANNVVPGRDKISPEYYVSQFHNLGDRFNEMSIPLVIDDVVEYVWQPASALWVQIVKTEDVESIRVLLSHFGEGDDGYDFAMLTGAPSLTMPHRKGFSGMRDGPITPELTGAQLKSARLNVARLQVQEWLHDQRKVRRYYRLILWSRMFFYLSLESVQPSLILSTKEDPIGVKRDYWIDARCIMLYLALTGDYDWVGDTPVTDLDRVFGRWMELYLDPIELRIQLRFDSKRLELSEHGDVDLEDLDTPITPTPFDSWKWGAMDAWIHELYDEWIYQWLPCT